MTQSNLKIAVTGGIGSGKTSVCQIIKEQGFYVVSCDEIYTELLKCETFIKKLADAFGAKIIDNGTLNRDALSKIVFNNKSKLQLLNSIAHPAIMSEVERRANGKKICFCEVPLLFENGFEKLFDAVIVVLREKQQRILSVSERNNISQEEAILRINCQFDYDNCTFAEYYVIHNYGDLVDLKIKTIELLQKIKN